MTTPATPAAPVADSTAAADAAVADLFTGDQVGKPAEHPHVDTGVKPTVMALQGVAPEERPPLPIEKVSLEHRKSFYLAVQHGGGKVTWDMPIGDPKADAEFKVIPQYVTFTSLGAAEIEVRDKIVRLWSQDRSMQSLDAFQLGVNRLNLFLQMIKYGAFEFKIPARKRDGSYDVKAVVRYVEQSVRQLGSVPFANALRALAAYEEQLMVCMTALSNGSFSSAGR